MHHGRKICAIIKRTLKGSKSKVHQFLSKLGEAVINKTFTKTSGVRTLIGLVISIIAIGVVLSMTDMSQLWLALQRAQYSMVSLGYIATLIWLSIRTVVWRTLLQDQTKYGDTFFAINEGYFLNNLFPLRLGELGRSFLLARKSNLEFIEVFSTVLLERIIDVGFAAGLLLATISFVIGASWAKQAALLAAIGVCSGFIILYTLANYRENVLARLKPSVTRWGRTANFLLRQFESFLNGITVLKDKNRIVRVIFWMVLNWGVAFFQFFLFMRAFFPKSEPVWAAFSLAVVALGIAVPSSPGNVGVLELAMVWALSFFQADTSTSTALAVTVHFSNFIITTILGIWGFTREGETVLSIYRRLRQHRMTLDSRD